MNTSKITQGTQVFCPEHPEYGYGVVKLIEDDFLSDSPTCQIAFEWVPGLQTAAESSLQVIQPIRENATIEANEWGTVDALRQRLGAAVLMAENSQTGSFIRSFTSPLPHQAFLLDKVVSQNLFGHLIADDVGMGKTIEAGLIISAIRQREPQARILVLAPAGVVLQWQDEMEDHFGLEFSIAGKDFNAKHRANWTNHNLILASLDMLKMDQHRELLSEIPTFDLVVCDEAHRLTARRDFLSNQLVRTQNYRFVEWLVDQKVVEWVAGSDGAPRAPQLLLMTATPHQGDDLRFAYLLGLLRPDAVDPETASQPDGALSNNELLESCITRTSKKRAVDWEGKSIFKGHDSRTLDFELTAPEAELLEGLTRYVLNDMRFAEGGNALVRALALHTFQKIAASSWAALESALRKRLGGQTTIDADDRGEGGIEAGTLDDADATEISALEKLLSDLLKLQTNSKWNLFTDLLRPGNGFRDQKGERILIFTQYRQTQIWLAQRLSDAGERVALINGDLSLEERKAQRMFFESEGTILISTEAGSEGANLHRKCHLEINFDIPWNPMRLLQRIGRLDRYGQKYRVRVVNLRAPRSWDSQISIKITDKLTSVQTTMEQIADEDYRSMILGEIHEAIDVADIMRRCDWGRDSKALDKMLDDQMHTVLKQKPAMDRLFRESMGMPEQYSQSAPSLGPEDFRQTFAWAAESQEIKLKETRTADNRFLKGVYHFTLPDSFRAGLRASREAYLVFDREIFAQVRGEILGQARGQPIQPALAGFGDPVTDWFFRSALHARFNPRLFALEAGDTHPASEKWWYAYGLRWKPGREWTGPDAVACIALDRDNQVLRSVPVNEIQDVLKKASSSVQPPEKLAGFSDNHPELRKILREIVPQGADPSFVAYFPLAVLAWSSL